MYKFKVSKYKNIVANIPKKNEGWINENVSVNTINGHSNLIKTSAAIIAYFCDGGNIGINHVNNSGKSSILRAHGAEIRDLDFSPFDDGILVTCSKNGHIKVWQFNDIFPDITVPNNPIHTLTRDKSIELTQFHPIVDSLLTSATESQIHVWDLINSKVAYESPECSSIQSMSWKYDGGLLVISNNMSQIKIWDPRIEKSQSFGLTFAGHENNRDSRVVWLGTVPYIISCGFNKRKAREAFLWDTRSNQKPVGSLCEFEPSNGVWIPLFDYDANMLFLAGRNDSAVYHWEIDDIIKQPSNFDNIGTNKHVTDIQIKGATIVNKRALKVMETEVNRLYLMGSDFIAPLQYKVPRKSYRDFHTDLFPETKSPHCSVTLDEWKQFNDGQMQTVSLNPNVNKYDKLIRLNVTLGEKPERVTPDIEVDQFLHICEKDGIDVNASLKMVVEKPQPSHPKPLPRNAKPEINNKPEIVKIPKSPNPSPQRRGFSVRTTKFRHLKGVISGRESQITNFNGLCKTIPGECNGFKVNDKFAAIPIGPNCNQLAIITIDNGKRLSGGVIPHLVCGHSIGDFSFNPFDNNRIAVGCDNGTIQLWNIPSDGLTDPIDTFDIKLDAHDDRITIVQFHPLASDVLASFSMDLMLIIWDIKETEPKIRIDTHSEPLHGFGWSPCGKLMATFCKDQKIRVFDPRADEKLVNDGPGPPGSRGGRICWGHNGMLIVSGFSRVSERQFLIYNATDISSPIASEGLDVSPAILIPFFDEDSRTLFLTGKGDSTIFAFELSLPEDGAPYIHHLSHYNVPTPHQAVVFLNKNACDVRKVEFARGFRLTPSAIEPVSFTVPRLRSEYFQDDLFPRTKVLWKPSLSASEWFSGINKEPSYIDLKPGDMTLLSEAPPPAPTKKEINAQTQIQFEGDISLQSSLAFLQSGREKQEMLVQKMSEKVDFNDDVLPQEGFEGVDPHEWDDANE